MLVRRDAIRYKANDDEILKIYCYYTVVAKITFLVSYRNVKCIAFVSLHTGRYMAYLRECIECGEKKNLCRKVNDDMYEQCTLLSVL